MKIERDSLRGEGSLYRPGGSLLGERHRSTATLDRAVRPGGGMGAVADARLLQHYASDGDQSAFTTLVEKYQSMVIGTALRHTRNAELAREVAQEVFAALAGKARTLTKRDSLAGWLHRAALYESVHVLKAETRRRARNERYSNQIAIFAAPGANESRSADRLAVIDEALDDLPENDREALVLHYFQDLSYPEMAQALGLSEPAVRQRVSRALHHLELALRSRGYTGDALVLLLAAVATQSSLAIPAGLPAAALALAQGGASSALPLWLSGLLPTTTKTAALILAVAGTALLWETKPPAPLIANATSIAPPVRNPVVESTSEPPRRLASMAQQAQPLPRTKSEAALRVVARQNAMVQPGFRPTELAQSAQSTKPSEPRETPRARAETLPPSVPPAPRDDAPSPRPIARDGVEGSGALEAAVDDLPRLAWELRDAELLPLRAAELYTDLLTQLLDLNDSQQLRVEEFLVGHYEQLRDQAIAGVRPPDFPTAEWRSARQFAADEAVAGVEAAVEDNTPVIRTVLTLADEVEVSVELDGGDIPILGL